MLSKSQILTSLINFESMNVSPIVQAGKAKAVPKVDVYASETDDASTVAASMSDVATVADIKKRKKKKVYGTGCIILHQDSVGVMHIQTPDLWLE